jgi:hypothetical protein
MKRKTPARHNAVPVVLEKMIARKADQYRSGDIPKMTLIQNSGCLVAPILRAWKCEVLIVGGYARPGGPAVNHAWLYQ